MKSLIERMEYYRELILEHVDFDRFFYAFIPKRNIYIKFFRLKGFEIVISTSQDFTSEIRYVNIPESWFSLLPGVSLKDARDICYYTRKVGMPGCKFRFAGVDRRFSDEFQSTSVARRFSDGSYRDFPRLINRYEISPSFKDFKNEIEFILENELLKLI